MSFVITPDEADRFLAHIAAAGLNLFYLRVPVAYGFTAGVADGDKR